MAQEITLFEKILKGTIPAKIVYEDDHTLAFDDIAPQAPVHVLVIPKIKIVNVALATEEHISLLGHVLWAAQQVARVKGIHNSGYRLIMNNGQDGGQTVHYLHCHVMGGRALGWPPG